MTIKTIKKTPAVFFDRDGVLNFDKGYISKIEDLEWVPGAAEAVKMLNELGFLVFVITNQSGVARGYYSEEDVIKLHRHMEEELGRNQAVINEFCYCPHHDEGEVLKYKMACDCRKPSPGMIEKILRSWPVDKERSFVVGDRITDVQAARAANLKGYLFEGGRLDDFIKKILDEN